MYQFKISPEIIKIEDDEDEKVITSSSTGTTEKAPTTVDELINSFSTIDSSYGSLSKITSGNSNDIATTLGLEKMSYTEPTEEEITQQAENSLSDYKQNSVSNIEEETETEKENLLNSKAGLISSADEEKTETASVYAKAKDSTEKDALKRGLARSSIVINQLAAFTNNEINEYQKISDELSSALKNIENSIANLEIKKQNSLNNFNITYAIKLSEKIANLEAEQEEKEAEVIKYNNEIAEKEAEYAQKISESERNSYQEEWERQLALAEYQNKYGSLPSADAIAAEKYNLALTYFNNLPKDQALAELESNQLLKEQLGKYYFELFNLLGERSE
ncbi:MAG: hypothetical protein WC942_03000 [Clostridia bacterium]